MEPAREMLHDQDLPMHQWAEATRKDVYVHNYTPHRVLKNKTLEEVFFSKKLEVRHLKIFGCLVHIHILKEKRTKLYPSGNKGIFVGYSESSKAYRIYFPRYKKIDINRDVTFDEDIAYNKSKKRHAKDPEEEKAPKIHDTTINEEIQEEDREFEEPQRPVDLPLEKNPHKRKPAWVQELIHGAERYGDPEENHRERKRTRSCSGYVISLIKNLLVMKKR